MKKEFIGFYEPTKAEIDAAWTNGFFAFDANSLLNLYRYTKQTREDFLLVLKTIKDRLFIPYQAAFEYHTNRLNVIDDLYNAHEKLSEIVRSNYTSVLLGKINEFKRHPSIDVDVFAKLCESFIEKLESEIKKQKKNHPDFRNEDEVLDQITSITEKCIGLPFTKKELDEIYQEGKARYSSQIPPGYKDAESKKNRGDSHIYGDLVIWRELINHSKEKKQPLIFVTDDRKQDWWTIQNGKTIRPREELVKEFFDLTGIRILIYNVDQFLMHAKERGLASKVKQKTIIEIKDIRISDENKIASISTLLGGKRHSYYDISPSYRSAIDWANFVSNSGISGPDPTTNPYYQVDPGFMPTPSLNRIAINFDPSSGSFSPGFEPVQFNPGSAITDPSESSATAQRFEPGDNFTIKTPAIEDGQENQVAAEPRRKKKNDRKSSEKSE